MIEIALKHQLGGTLLNVNECLPSSGITAIFGRSGSGKTSLINAIAGLISPDEGRIKVADRTLFDRHNQVNVAVEKRNIGYVFQDARLFPHYSVKGNLLYGVKGTLDQDHFSRIMSLLNLSALLDRYPIDLSGGEKQRVAIARALLSNPDMLLMDEPLASLDLPRKKEVMPFLERLSRQVNIPILYVTHSLSEMLRLADHILIMDEGQVAASGRLEDVWASDAMRPWKSFSEQSSLFDANVIAHHDKYALSKVALTEQVALWVQHIDEEVGTPIRLQIRANDVSICLERATQTSIRNIIPAKIHEIGVQSNKHGNQSIEIILALDTGCLLQANITQWAFDELNLTKGQAVFAQIKGVSVAQKDMAMMKGASS